MNAYQEELLYSLASNLEAIIEEYQRDHSFSDVIDNLEIWKYSIDEMASRVRSAIENE